MPHALHPILVVDDSLDIRMMLQIALHRAGYTPTIVATGSAALDALATTAYALLLIDLHLPDMAGSEIIRHARKHPRCPPVILMSGESWADVQRAVAALPQVDFLAKPFSITDLQDALAHALQPRALAADPRTTLVGHCA